MPQSEEGRALQAIFTEEDWHRHLLKSDTGKLLDCWQNVRQVLQYHPAWTDVLWFDDFAQVACKRKPAPTGAAAGAWTADDDYLLGMWLAQMPQRLLCKAMGTVSGGVIAYAQSRRFHPVREWLDGLEWDRTPRLETWLHECLGAQFTPYTQAVGRYFLLNMVARIYEPGCIMRSMPVLEGTQNRGKSTALRLLVGDAWFSDSQLDLSSKDAFELVQGVWLYEISEMHAFNRMEANRVKQFLSSTTDHWVPKYVRGRVSVRRQTCFAGTTNESLYLRDWTGNTRFWPFRCEEEGGVIELDRLADQREQLFAEATWRYKAGERRYPTAEEGEALFGPAQEARLQEHPWTEPVQSWLAYWRAAKVTVYEVLSEALKVEKSRLTLQMQQDVGRILVSLGWERRREPTGARRWYYTLPDGLAPSGQPALGPGVAPAGVSPRGDDPPPF